jgi:3-oxoacyl-ACP reductase-like protein
MRDPCQGEILYDKEKARSLQIQARLYSIGREHGDTYIKGIQPVFNVLKACHFDSSWKWVHQDAILMFYDILSSRLTTVDREITARYIAIMNCANPDLIKFMEFMVNCCDPTKGEMYATAKKLGQELLDNCQGVVGQPPLYKVTFPLICLLGPTICVCGRACCVANSHECPQLSSEYSRPVYMYAGQPCTGARHSTVTTSHTPGPARAHLGNSASSLVSFASLLSPSSAGAFVLSCSVQSSHMQWSVLLFP